MTDTAKYLTNKDLYDEECEEEPMDRGEAQDNYGLDEDDDL
jgi:hypothetical protein